MGRPKLGDGETERLHIKITAEELSAIDEWRFANRIASRSEAVRRLCKVGLFVDDELGPIVDTATEGVGILAYQWNELAELSVMLTGPENDDVLFGREEIHDVLRVAGDYADVAERGLSGIQHSLVTMYDAIAGVIDAKTFKAGVQIFERRIAEANEAFEKMGEKAKQREDNRYLVIWVSNEGQDERERYEAMSDDEQDAFLSEQIERLRAEETADPDAFAKRYGIREPFWETAGWRGRLPKRSDLKTERTP